VFDQTQRRDEASVRSRDHHDDHDTDHLCPHHDPEHFGPDDGRPHHDHHGASASGVDHDHPPR
jgi:hypothetical protein